MHEGRLKLANARAFLGKLTRDTRANTLAIMAAALIPLAGMVGGGIDISRMYIVKTRLQHACDAGALAGRKSMGGGTWNQTVGSVANYPQVTAGQFFDANYNSAAYGATNVSKSFTENAGKVSGSAQATLPMTLMRIFGKTTETLTVTCDAEMRLPNTDVMFVLDVTGSMADPQPGDTVTKMAALKTAVKCFYEIVARLDTDANCTTGTPSGGTGNQVQIRFGFVPYDQNVNVGRLLKPEWFADSWEYQTRQANWTPPGTTSNGPYWEVYSGGSISQSDCLKFMNNQSFSGFSPTPTTSGSSPSPKIDVTFQSDGVASQGGNNGEFGWNGSSDNSGTNQSCRRQRTDTTTTYVPAFKDWTYDQMAVNVSLLKNGTNWNNNFQWPVGNNGVNKTIAWDGCIEERKTVSYTSYDPIPSDAKDLDIDTVPNSADTKWGMALPGLTYTRASTSTNNTTNWSRASSTTTTNYSQGANYTCPVSAKKLQRWPSASDFDTYVDTLQPGGNTYHDAGLVWGARLMSPGDANGNGGLFAAENKLTDDGGEIERHMIFMTDGDACTDLENYTSHGVDWYNPVTLPASTTPSEGCTSTGNLTQQINLRTEGLCTAIKNHKITLWVIAFGNLAATTETRLTNCATTGRYFKATSAADLQATFKKIADQISALRLTK
ncbi:Tad domain-containing protein [Sphingomonas sp. R-74633]|uniref:TadE/TadG family type IV pilus assembly protein n=1 Tax=Sphingomonas sp. R-74633 TaxID=2751188 RepID=UPI0015D1CB1F|nr:TadE/TadG family type IV pilus assembly protein [Sphingomonas sp. R-74633]NYT39979.1 Tad domain-containing protein [Sphingomonas sp. R-74633]